MGSYGRRLEPAPDRFGQVPRGCGVIFICRLCGRPTATTRDACLRAWGERGVIGEAAAKLRCKNCRKRGGMDAALTPLSAKMGSPTPLDRLVEAMRKLRPSGSVNERD